MSDMEINQVLAQMRVMAAAAGNINSGRDLEGAEGAGGADFGTLMKDSIAQVNEAKVESKELATAFEMGDPDVSLPEVMVAMQKASLSFQAMTQVRNKLLSAYQEVMNMQV
ncbi:MAG: flagellar hook-basal body complex protein FliE [Porticoccus sp.]